MPFHPAGRFVGAVPAETVWEDMRSLERLDELLVLTDGRLHPRAPAG